MLNSEMPSKFAFPRTETCKTCHIAIRLVTIYEFFCTKEHEGESMYMSTKGEQAELIDKKPIETEGCQEFARQVLQ